MSVVHAWEGAPSDEGVWVRAKITGASARLAVSTDPSLNNPAPVFFGPDTATSDGMVSLRATGLDAETTYYWQVEDDSVLDPDWTGRFTTLRPVGSLGTHTVAYLSCGGAGASDPGAVVTDRVSNHPGYDAIRTNTLAPVLGVDLGDKHYRDIGTGTHSPAPYDETDFRDAYDDCLTYNGTLGAEARQGKLWRELPTAYMFDNHDYSFDTASHVDADKTAPARDACLNVYRERVPHFPLPAGSGPVPVYQTWVIDRTRYILLDVRSDRDPKDDPDGPDHTMLGIQQREWLETLLGSAGEQLLVLAQPHQWVTIPTESDGWTKYEWERQWLIDLLTTTGWIDRMLTVYGNDHALGIDTGANSPGNIPAFLFSSIDSAPSTEKEVYDLGHFPGKGQYGTITIADDGDLITVTGTGWRESEIIVSHTFSVAARDEPGPDPEPVPIPPVPVAEARIRDKVTWLGVHRTTGRIIAELPDVTGDPARQLSGYATSSLTVPITRGGPGHVPVQLLEACTDGASGALVAVVNDLPIWMGLPVVQDNQMGRISLPSCPSTEAYLLKRKVRDLSRVDTDRARVALALAQQAEAINGLDGQGLGFEYDVEDTGDLITISYAASDRQTHYDAIRDLCVGGLEFEVYYDWADNSQTTVVKILRIRRRIGRVTGAPEAMFETGDAGSVTNYRDTRSWAEGKYANHVTALAPGQGEDQPASSPAIDQAAIDAGVPWVELIVEPGNNITGSGLLDEFAQAELARVKGGTSALTIDARLDGYPRPGVDASLGDQISYLLESDRHPLTDTADLRLRGERRMTSMVIRPDQNTWTPGLVEDPLLGVS